MIAKWIFVGLSAPNVLITIGSVGKPRKPITPADAVHAAIANAIVVAAVLIWWQ